MMRVVRGGLLTTVQDLGRSGVQQHGVAAGGAMDRAAHRIVNLLAGNAADAATLEATLLGPAIEFDGDTLLALGGADLNATLDGESAPMWRPFIARSGSVLSLDRPRSGCRAYIAVAGGIDVPRVLGSRSTDLIACFGGVDGRALRSGDTLARGSASDLAQRISKRIRTAPADVRAAGRSLLPRYSRDAVVRVMRGPEHARFTAPSRALLFRSTFQVSPQSNRMGLRLTGPPLALADPYDLFSSPVATGTIQVPPSGEPIVLMADHQTIGGYPRIANVVSVDLPLLAQAPPGAGVRFREVDVDEAQALYRAREIDFRIFAEALRIHYS